MKRKVLTLIAAASMLIASLSGCGTTDTGTAQEAAVAATDTPAADKEEAQADSSSSDAYQGELTVMHFSTEEEAKGNPGADGFRKMVAEWEESHPDITLSQNILANTEYKTQIATLAANDDLPDIYVLQGMDAVRWGADGLALDLTDVVVNSPDNVKYKKELFNAFTSDGKIYGIPALTGGTCTAIIYDSKLWAEAGFDTFPTTWEDVVKAKDFFDKKGITVMGFANKDQWQANSTFLTCIGNRFTGMDWFSSLVANDGAMFTDQSFVDALTFMQNIFASGIFNEDFNAIDHYTAREYYISGDCAAYIGGNWDMTYIGATLEESNPELFANSKLAVFPQPEGATGDTDTQANGLGYALAINPKVAEDPAKLAAAIDFIYKTTGADFANYVSSNYAVSGLTAPDSVDLSKFNQLTQDLYNFTYVDYKSSQIYDSFISGALWGALNTDLQSMLNGDITPEAVAENAQAAYEEVMK
ncbi:carbohydrate ABC transporter substrate-binding protein (CUT1 family) [Kineothrix alysoides]|uniref:Carbohydrate ABC transporter substrate-binding protein (CUT1 family) n=1 Tax=Kineothrix alysoides TaxID=1469948 RepID=A0A4R1QMI2_9FIRM|nr:extracellular solute-binding protein [Kineothrix alysoides]TCL53991.1 carbohydrate ABC transporter substrate-binding protein (CUT1 family) [Kineothrix alysoides]